MATTRTFHGTARALDLRLPVGHARVTVDPVATDITVTLSTANDAGPSVDAIGDAIAHCDAGRFTVHVPDIAASVIGGGVHTVVTGGNHAGGGLFVSQSVGTVYGEMNGIVFNGGRVVSAGFGSAVTASPIDAEVTVPAGTVLSYSGTSASLTVTGHLIALQFKTVSGRLRLASVTGLHVNTTSGDVDADVVFGSIAARTVSGDVSVGSYQGTAAAISSVSGDVRLNAGRDAHGALQVKTVSGDVRLRGVDRLEVSASTVSGDKTIN